MPPCSTSCPIPHHPTPSCPLRPVSPFPTPAPPRPHHLFLPIVPQTPCDSTPPSAQPSRASLLALFHDLYAETPHPAPDSHLTTPATAPSPEPMAKPSLAEEWTEEGEGDRLASISQMKGVEAAQAARRRELGDYMLQLQVGGADGNVGKWKMRLERRGQRGGDEGRRGVGLGPAGEEIQRHCKECLRMAC